MTDILTGKRKIALPIIFLGVLVLLTLTLTTAQETSSKELNYTKSFQGYPTIIHKNILGQEIQSFELEQNDLCLVDCKSVQKIILKNDGSLFDEIRFLDSSGSEIKIQYSIRYEITENYTEDVPVYKEICREVKIDNESMNGTIESCTKQVEIQKNESQRTYWKNYSYEKMPAGTYKVLFEVNKDPNQNIDWQIKANGIWNTEQAWWNSSWAHKKQINVTGGNSTLSYFPIFLKVLYTASMNTTYTDLRFLNSSETGEYYYYIESMNTTNANVWVRVDSLTTGNNIVYMYYGNSQSPSTSSPITFSNYTSVYSLSDTSNITGRNTITPTGTLYSSINAVFGNSTSTNYTNTATNYYTFNIEFVDDAINPSGTLGFWLNLANNRTFPEIMGKGIQGSSTDYCFGTDASGNVGDGCWGTMSSGQAVNDSLWHYLTWTWGSSDRIYIDGIDRGAMRSPTSMGGATTDYLFTGYHFATYTGNTSIDMFTFTNDLRSASWIAREYQNYNSSYTVFGDEENPFSCNFMGYIKDKSGNAINGANVVAYAQADTSVYNTTTDATGFWNINISKVSNYTVFAYYNTTLTGGAKSYIQCA